MYIYIYIYTSTYTPLTSKIHNHQIHQLFRNWNLNQQEFVLSTAMLLVEVLALNKCLLGEMKHIYKMKSLKNEEKS